LSVGSAAITSIEYDLVTVAPLKKNFSFNLNEEMNRNPYELERFIG